MPKNKHNAAAVLLKIKQRDQFLAEVVDLRESFLETISCNPLHSQGCVEEGLQFVSRKARIAHLISVYLCEIVDVLEQENSPNGDFWLVIALAVLAERAERKPDQHLTTEVYDKILKVISKFVKVFDAVAFTGLGQFTESPAFSRDERLAHLRAAATYFGVLAYFFDDGKQEAASGKEHFGLQLREHTMTMMSGPEAAEEAPWYPDDSGEWVEVTGKGRPKGLKKSTVVEALLAGERKGEYFTSLTDKVGDLNWRRAGQGLLEHLVIVAYRIVKKD